MKDIRASIILNNDDKMKVLNSDLEFLEYEGDERIEVILDGDGDGYYKRNVDKRLGRNAGR